jgi:hypothetical protein
MSSEVALVKVIDGGFVKLVAVSTYNKEATGSTLVGITLALRDLPVT